MTAKEWIKQGDKEYYSASEGLEGRIVITTSQARILKIDGNSTIQQILVNNDFGHLVDQIVRKSAVILSPTGEKFALTDIPTVTDQVLITNIAKAA